VRWLRFSTFYQFIKVELKLYSVSQKTCFDHHTSEFLCLEKTNLEATVLQKRKKKQVSFIYEVHSNSQRVDQSAVQNGRKTNRAEKSNSGTQKQS